MVTCVRLDIHLSGAAQPRGFGCAFFFFSPRVPKSVVEGATPQIRGDGFSQDFRPSFLRLLLPRIISEPEFHKNNMHTYAPANVVEHAREHLVM